MASQMVFYAHVHALLVSELVQTTMEPFSQKTPATRIPSARRALLTGISCSENAITSKKTCV